MIHGGQGNPDKPRKPGRRTCRNALLAIVCLSAIFAVKAHPQAASPAQKTARPGPVLGIVRGTVQDTDGDALEAATVTLNPSQPAPARTLLTDEQGRFVFSDVPAGPFSLTITAAGFADRRAAGTLALAQSYELYGIEMAIVASAVVEVTTSRKEMADEEIRIEETQKLLGALPNFYVVYDWHAAPMDAHQKFSLAWKNFINPVNQGIDFGIAGLQYATGGLSGYGSGPGGYFKRFAADTADFGIGSFLGGAIFPVLLRQDPRYFYMGPSQSRKKRFFYALSSAVICRGDNGKWQPNYSSVLGDLGSGAFSNLYYPKSNRSDWDVAFYNGLIAAGSDGIGNVVQEFLLKHLTPHAPNYPR